MKIIWTQYASNDLNKAFEYALDKFGQTQVKHLKERVTYAKERISKFPTACPLEHLLLDKQRQYRYVSLFKNLELIFHQEEDDIILIDAVWDSRQNPQRLRKRLD